MKSPLGLSVSNCSPSWQLCLSCSNHHAQGVSSQQAALLSILGSLGSWTHVVFPTVVFVVHSENMCSIFPVLLVITSALSDHDFHGKKAQHMYGCLLISISSSEVLLAVQQIVSPVPNKFQLCNNFPTCFQMP